MSDGVSAKETTQKGERGSRRSRQALQFLVRWFGKMSLNRCHLSQELEGMKNWVWLSPGTESLSGRGKRNAVACGRRVPARWRDGSEARMAGAEWAQGRLGGEESGGGQQRGRHFACASNGWGSCVSTLAVISMMWEAVKGTGAQEWPNLIHILKRIILVPCWK